MPDREGQLSLPCPPESFPLPCFLHTGKMPRQEVRRGGGYLTGHSSGEPDRVPENRDLGIVGVRSTDKASV